jgi:hypothetical protein
MRLLRMGGQRNLPSVSIDSLNGDKAMNTEFQVFARLAQAFLAISATGVSVLVLQFAMLAA